MGDEKHIRWQDLAGPERLKLIEQLWQGRMTKSELCRTLHMSRQVLHRATVAAQEAAQEALEPKRPGRKTPTEDQARITELEAAMAVKDSVYDGDEAAMGKVTSKAWTYMKRANLHANGLGTS